MRQITLSTLIHNLIAFVLAVVLVSCHRWGRHCLAPVIWLREKEAFAGNLAPNFLEHLASGLLYGWAGYLFWLACVTFERYLTKKYPKGLPTATAARKICELLFALYCAWLASRHMWTEIRYFTIAASVIWLLAIAWWPGQLLPLMRNHPVAGAGAIGGLMWLSFGLAWEVSQQREHIELLSVSLIQLLLSVTGVALSTRALSAASRRAWFAPAKP